ncbi:MAG: hypothetical protein J0H09_27135 [Burkholderiales bacterium]|nr:hypothetical protein [Burkholderiales bacterium]
MQTNDGFIPTDHDPFVNSYWLSIKDYGDGEREVMLQRYDRRCMLPAEFDMDARKRRFSGSGGVFSSKREDPGPFDEAFDLEAFYAWRDACRERAAKDAANRERAARRARSECCARLKAIRADRMITLTYRENMTDRDRLARDWKEFVRRVRRVMGFDYVATYERQKRGAWHMHVGVHGRQNYRLLRSVWRSIVGADGGNIDVRNPFKQRGLRHKLAAYMSKYIAKNAVDGESGERRVWCSKGINRPDREVYGGRFESWPAAVDQMMSLVDPALPLVAWYCRRRELMFFATTNPC